MEFNILVLLKFCLKISWLFIIGVCLLLSAKQSEIIYFLIAFVICVNLILQTYIKKITKIQNNKLALMLSHDLKTPVMAQLKALEIINLCAADNEFKVIYSQMYNSCKYMEKMIYNLISIHKFAQGNSHLEFTNISLTLLMKEVFEELKPLADEKQQEFSLICSAENSKVTADRLEIKRVLTNLIFNAIKYSEKNSKIAVTIGNYDNHNLICNVRNTGKPFKKGFEKIIFDKYKRFDSKINYNSDGLGLYLCKKIISSHRGKIFIKTDYVNTNMIGFTLPKSKVNGMEKFHLRTKKILQQLSNLQAK